MRMNFVVLVKLVSMLKSMNNVNGAYLLNE
jgi:hypothetical protein